MFKLAHCSDPHAGYRSGVHVNKQGINLREADGYMAFQEMVTDIIKNEVDAAVFCGDIFHTPNPKTTEVVFVQNQLRRLAAVGIAVYLLAGNHDTNDIKSDIAASRVLNDPLRKIYSHAEPYAKHEIGDGIHLHLVSHHMYQEQADTMKLIKPTPSEVNIFSTHGSVIDPLLKEKLKTEQSPREIVIPDFLLNDRDWSYTLLGHIHERGWVGSKDGRTDSLKKRIYYNGSLIRRGFSDKEVKLGRGWTLWEIDSSGEFKPTPKKVAQRPQYDFAAIDAAKLTPNEISEKIIERLRETQVDGTNFISATAPILRQKVINLTPSKHSALDWTNFNRQSAHAMQFEVKPLVIAGYEEPTSGKLIVPGDDLQGNGDVVKLYSDWIQDNKLLEETSKDLRATIIKQTTDFITKAQEKILDNEK